jgi:aminopeptidase YwaD
MKGITRFLFLPFTAILSILITVSGNSQDINYAKSITEALCSPEMHGRGYTMNGDLHASSLIKKEFHRIGLKPYNNSYFQPFRINVNTFPGAMKLAINGKILEPGCDYLIDPASGKCKGDFEAFTVSIEMLVRQNIDSAIAGAKGMVLVIDARTLPSLSEKDKAVWNVYRKILLAENRTRIRAVIELTNEKLTFGISPVAHSIPYFRVNMAACPEVVSTVSMNVRNHFLDQYETRNVAGFVRGREYPDSLVVLMAHYDHLGTMGKKVYFPGANDNASGVSMILAMAEYFQAHPSPFSIVFLAFSGEELGLMGSEYFVDHPLVDLKAIKFLINLDLVGNGTDGITVVNGGIFHEWFSTLIYINDAQQLLPAVKRRGESCNSDHCPFYRKGVPSFFIYTMGGPPAYHDLDDRPESLNYEGFEGLTKLLIEFVRRLY